jgi:hypothetical protein
MQKIPRIPAGMGSEDLLADAVFAIVLPIQKLFFR